VGEQRDPGVRLAVDVGGTFTDVVLERGGRHLATKVLTTHGAPAEGVLRGVERILAEAGTTPGEVALLVHGTTLATNALIERRGARTALITTAGHRDALEMAHEDRFAQYDLHAERRAPLVPRALRLAVGERLAWDGEVIEALDEASVAALVPRLREAAVESIAVGLLHAYANPAHERRVRAILERELPGVPISLASEVCPEIREYERQSTTCANAYLRPLIGRYLRDLEARLAAAGLACPCLLMTSAGSLVTIDTAVEQPVRLIESGPAGGAILAAHLARRLGERSVVAFDMGGTTAKLCLIDDGEPALARSFEVDRAHRFLKGSGMPVKVPVVEMVEIGAGGGSIAARDALGRVRVGPRSAGSEPGPACYRRGGEQPTVTDADLLLGRLDAAEFAGGRLRLDAGAAREAFAAAFGGAGGREALAAAGAVVEVVEESMAAAARVHAAERGQEIAARTLIAFGGAAPLHAAGVAARLGIGRVLVPAFAGVGSALGLLLAPAAYEVVRSRYQRLERQGGLDAAAVEALYREMEAEARAVVARAAPGAALREQRHAYARHRGQGHEIRIEVAPGRPTAQALRDAFDRQYRRQYRRTVPGVDVEVLSWSLRVSAPGAPLPPAPPVPAPARPAPDGEVEVHSPGGGAPGRAALYRRERLAPGAVLATPALVREEQTTTVVPAGLAARVGAGGELVVEAERLAAARRRGAEAAALRRQLLWDRLISIVEEQAQALLRTAFSSTVREAGDLSAGVFDLRGRMLAQAVTGTPGHVNAMAASVGFFLERYPLERLRPGDVLVTNDPWLGTGHLFDFTVLTPVFRGAAPVALFASTVHVVDIGGRGFGPDAGQVYEEGLCVPIMALFAGGEINRSLLAVVEANVREPAQVLGDLYSLAASNEVGARRLLETIDELGLDGLEAIADHIVERSRAAMLAHIAELPAGVYENEMTVDGYGRAVRLVARLRIGADGIDIDFTGTSPVSPFGINVPLTYTQAYASFGVRCVVGGEVPNNAGSLAPIRVSAPPGCILNAPRPAAVTVRHVIGQMLPDVVLGCLEQACPGIAPAEGSSSLWNPMLAGGPGLVGEHDYGDATPFSVTLFHSGGSGARPGRDGLSATAFPSGVRNTPVEITESLAPLLIRRKEYRVGSGGAGRWRGGDGQVIEIEHRQGAPFAVFALFDRIEHPARGRHGGADGAPGRVALDDGTPLAGKGKQVVPAGRRLVLELPGGGGLGEP